MVLGRVLEIVRMTLRFAIGAGFLFALSLNFANVIMRYVFFAPVYWAEEAMIFVFVWCVFLGAALVALTGEHLRVELINWLLPPRANRILAVVTHLTAAVLMTFVAWRAWLLTGLVMRLHQTSIIGEIPMAVPYGAVLLGSILIVIASLLRVGELTLGLNIGRSGNGEH